MNKKSIGAGTITLGLLLITLGILFLLHNFTDLSVWNYVWKYWPLILIILGLSKIFQAITREKRSSAGEIFLIILIIIVGLSITAIANLGHHLDFGWSDKEYTYQSDEEISCPPDCNIAITNEYGDVEVIPWSKSSVKVVMNKEIWADNHREADRFQRNMRPIVERSANNVEVKAEFEELQDSWFDFNTDFKVMVPERSSIEVNCYDGDVHMEGLVGNQRIDCRNGDVDVINIDGEFKLDGREGEVSVEGISGKVEINSHDAKIKADKIDKGIYIDNPHGDILVSSVKGGVRLKTKHSNVEGYDINGKMEIEAIACNIYLKNIDGDLYIKNRDDVLEIEEVSGDVVITAPNSKVYANNIERDLTIESSNETVEAGDIVGRVEIKGEDLQVLLKRVSGPIDVKTSNNAVELKSCKTPVTIEDINGEVRIYNCLELAGKIEVTTSAEDIILELPADSSFNIDAKALNGSITSQFSGSTLHLIEDGENTSLQGSLNQGLHTIRLRVRDGNIRIMKVEEEIEL